MEYELEKNTQAFEWYHFNDLSILTCATPQSGNQVLTSLDNSWTVFARNRNTAVPAEGNGDLQTLICVLVDTDVPHCRILSPDKTKWRLISATLCGWRRCFVTDQLWFMTRIQEEDWLYVYHQWPMDHRVPVLMSHIEYQQIPMAYNTH